MRTRIVQGLRRHYLDDVESDRYTDADGNQLVIVTVLDGLRLGRREYVATSRGRWDLVEATRESDGAVFWLIFESDDKGKLRFRRSEGKDGIRIRTYQPADEPWPAIGYDTADDARAILQVDSVLQARRADVDARHAAADEARAPHDQAAGREWSRAGYEAACAAAGVVAVPDEELTGYNSWGVYALIEYTPNDLLAVSFAQSREHAIKAEALEADGKALMAATDAAGAGPYDRAAYETACAAAGLPVLTDRAAAGLASAYLDQAIARATGGVLVVGAPDEATTAVTLAKRRLDGIAAETRDHVCSKCERWLAPGEAMSASLGLACPDCYDDLSG